MNIFGAILVILTNCCYIANNYAVKWAGLGAGEVSLVRGAIQVLVFSAALLISTRAKDHRNNIESQKCKISWKSKCVNWQFKLPSYFLCLRSSSSCSSIPPPLVGVRPGLPLRVPHLQRHLRGGHGPALHAHRGPHRHLHVHSSIQRHL